VALPGDYSRIAVSRFPRYGCQSGIPSGRAGDLASLAAQFDRDLSSSSVSIKPADSSGTEHANESPV